MRNKILNLVFVFLFIIYVYEFFKYAFSPLLLNYENADLLINYSNGFIRRGFLGTMFLYFSNYLNPILLIRINVLISFCNVCIFFLYYFKKYKIDFRVLLFPFFLPYILMCNMLGFRDYILINIIWISLILYNKRKMVYLLVASVLLAIGCFIHEMFIIYVTSTLIILSVIEGQRKIIFQNGLILIPSFLVFLFVFKYTDGNENLPLIMYESIVKHLPKSSVIDDRIPNSLLALTGKVDGHIIYVFQLNNMGFSRGLIYLCFILFLFVFLYNLNLFTKLGNKFKLLPIIFAFLILMCIPLFYTAIDWQRFISMAFILSFVIYFNINKLEKNTIVVNKLEDIYFKFNFIKINSKESLIILSLFYIVPYINLGTHKYLFSSSILIIYSYISKLILQ